MSSATISRDECLHLNDILGVKTLSGCHNIKHTLAKRDDAFISSDQGKGLSDGDTHHRNSWLMPKMARRLTRNSPHHVSNWRPDVTVNLDDCRRIRSLLVEKMGSIHDAEQYLPRACKKM